MADSVQRLAERFVDATVRKVGTDEEEVYSVLKDVHDSDQQGEFEKEVFQLMDLRFKLHFNPVARNYLTYFILSDEMEGSALAKAWDIYDSGYERFRLRKRWRCEVSAQGLASPVHQCHSCRKV